MRWWMYIEFWTFDWWIHWHDFHSKSVVFTEAWQPEQSTQSSISQHIIHSLYPLDPNIPPNVLFTQCWRQWKITTSSVRGNCSSKDYMLSFDEARNDEVAVDYEYGKSWMIHTSLNPTSGMSLMVQSIYNHSWVEKTYSQDDFERDTVIMSNKG